MIKHKHFLVLLSLLVVIALVTACGGAQPQATEEAPATEVPAQPAAEATEAPAQPAAETAGYTCEDPLGCVEVEKDAPIIIASALTLSGPNTSLGLDTQHGVEIALQYKGTLLGHPLELQPEDDGCSAEGGQTAATKLAANKDVVAVIGHTCSSSCTPAAPIYNEVGLTMISGSCTAPSLTAPETHVPSFLRTAQNDSVQGKVAAEYAYNELGVRKIATIHDGSPYAEQLQAVFAQTFKDLGGEVTAQEAINVGDTDMRPLLTSIATGKPDLLYYPIFIAEGGFITVQSREVAGLEKTILMGADGLTSPDFIAAAGAAGEGVYLTGPDLSFTNDLYTKFKQTYKENYGSDPAAPYHAHAFDATNMVLAAIEKVAVESDDILYIPRQALRDTLYATKAQEGITGSITCDANGDCADPKIGITQVKDGKFVPIWPAKESAAAGSSDLMKLEAPNCDYGGKIKSIEAVDPLTVKFTMCKPDPAFLAKAAFTPFGIQPKEWLEKTGGTGELLEKPIGTGPYMIDSWNRGDSVVYKRFDGYWGEPAIAETMVLRWASEGAARLLELQSGTVDMIDNVSPDAFDTVKNDPNLKLLPRNNPNVLYLAMTDTFKPFDDVRVRQAIAMGIDRERIVANFYPEGSEVASHFTPCSIPNGCTGDDWYAFDPEAAKKLLADAGFADGFSTKIFYRDVFRPYLPEPGLVAVELQSQLKENLNIDAEIVVMESGAFIAESNAGRLDGFYMLGWGADYPHVTNFLDFHFGATNPQFGTPHPEIYQVLEKASQIADEAEAKTLYTEANNAIKELVPMVPIAHGALAQAIRADVKGAYARPFGSVIGALVDPGKDTFVFMQNAEPISLDCADETDGESLTACDQVVEPLLLYEVTSGDIRPGLATGCESNADATEWTCALRENVKFHDGSDFDANDVVASWAVGLDASNPLHKGNTGTYEYFSYLWDGLMNVPAE